MELIFVFIVAAMIYYLISGIIAALSILFKIIIWIVIFMISYFLTGKIIEMLKQ